MHRDLWCRKCVFIRITVIIIDNIRINIDNNNKKNNNNNRCRSTLATRTRIFRDTK